MGGLLGNALNGLNEGHDGVDGSSSPSPALQFDRAAVSVTAAIDALLFGAGTGPAALGMENSPTHALYGDLLTRATASDYPNPPA